MYVSVSLIWVHLSQTNPTEASSIAIWNKHRLVVGIAIIVCATNVSVIILGKLVPHSSHKRSGIRYQCDFISGIVQVNNLSRQLRTVLAYPFADALRMELCSARVYRGQH
jgi:hypothetical protein